MSEHNHNVYAYDKNRNEIYAEDAENGKKGYSCMGCGGELRVVHRKRPNIISFFRHYAHDVTRELNCSYSDETHRHKLAKQFLQDQKIQK